MWFWTLLGLLLPLDPSIEGTARSVDRPPIITNPQWVEKPVAPLMALAEEYGIDSGRYAVECESPASGSFGLCDVKLVGEETVSSGDPYIARRVGFAIDRAQVHPVTFDGLAIWSLLSFEISFSTVDGQRRVDVSEVVCARCLHLEYGEEVRFGVVGKNQAAYPSEATRMGARAGYAVLRCRANGAAPMTECSVWVETPFGLGFGREALKAVDEQRFDPRPGAWGLIWFVVPFEAE